MNIQVKCLFLILTVLGSLLPLHFVQAQRPIVRLIYFLPRDRQPQRDIDTKMDKLIKEVQQFFADQMEAHGLDRKTFQIETHANGKAVVHHVVGQFTDSHYSNLENTTDVWYEISGVFFQENGIWVRDLNAEGQFDPYQNIHLIAIDISNTLLISDGKNVCGLGGNWGTIGGVAYIPASGECFNLRIAAHELGHACGLHHDFRDNAYIMSYGGGVRKRFSKCTAQWLDIHRAFNSKFAEQTGSIQIKVLPPVIDAFTNTIRHRFEFSGVHQMQLLTDTLIGPAAGFPEVVDCKTLNRHENATVEVEDTKLTQQTKYFYIIDANGNFGMHREMVTIPVDPTLLLEPAEVVSISDVNLATAIRRTLGLEPADTLTTHIIQYLSTLNAYIRKTENNPLVYHERPITDLTGLKYARNLRKLDLRNILIGVGNEIQLHYNDVSDISPLMGLTQLTELDLRNNPLSYAAINTHIPAMQDKGIKVQFDNIAHPALLKNSGDAQQGLTGTLLPLPFVVEAQNENGQPMDNIAVTFTIHIGSGMLKHETIKTGVDGKARTNFILGWAPDTTIIHATAENFRSSVYFTATPTVLIHRAAEDVNGDGRVNVEDLMLVAATLGTEPLSDMLPNTDVNGDGIVNNDDIALVLAALEASTAAPLAVAKTGKVCTAETLARWIVEAKRYHTNDETFQRGIAALEQFLTQLQPKKTVLLANYPNPFNPETWIPYQLAQESDVQIRIYATNGTLIRALDLGHQSIGNYQSRSRAAYWDGKNEIGEIVSSGIYFYTLTASNFAATAGNFAATRKMLILK